MRDTQRKTQAEREAGSMQGPDMGLDPGAPGSGPGLKAGAKPLSHPGCPFLPFLMMDLHYLSFPPLISCLTHLLIKFHTTFNE